MSFIVSFSLVCLYLCFLYIAVTLNKWETVSFVHTACFCLFIPSVLFLLSGSVSPYLEVFFDFNEKFYPCDFLNLEYGDFSILMRVISMHCWQHCFPILKKWMAHVVCRFWGMACRIKCGRVLWSMQRPVCWVGSCMCTMQMISKTLGSSSTTSSS